MPHAKRSRASNMHGGRPRNSPGLRRGQMEGAPFKVNHPQIELLPERSGGGGRCRPNQGVEGYEK